MVEQQPESEIPPPEDRKRLWLLWGFMPLLVVAVLAAAAFVAIEIFAGGDGSKADDRTNVGDIIAAADCGPLPERSPGAADGLLAPEVVGIQTWINSESLCLSELRGKVVLVDFWTYTCVNCIRTFPFLKLWNSKYADDGLIILGIHTPEFIFEENPDNVRQATQENGIVWPVALDNDYGTWRAYDNRFWPAKYLIDKDSIIRYTHFGEGEYAATELKIRELLEEAGAELSKVNAALSQDQEIDPSFLEDPSAGVTPELYGGYLRGCNPFGAYFVANPEYCQSLDQVQDYHDPEDNIGNAIYLQGPWYAGEESLRYASDNENSDLSDYMALRFSAKSVNAVITPEGDEPFQVVVTLDGEYLTDDNKGEDIVIDKDGKSILVIDQPRMYRVVEAPQYGTYELKLSPSSSRFALFAFTFGIYESGA